MANVTAEELLRGFEGYSPTAYWDVNAWRIGYGSDTMTDADGNIVRVTKESTTTKEDAARDLARRIPEFQKQGIIPFVGKDNWERLPAATKAAVTSVAYNYGSLENLRSLTKAIKAGDSDGMAAALKKYASHNDGVNEKRRIAEAKIVAGNPIPKVGMATDGVLKLQDIQDRNATARGYGELGPQPKTISPALQAARTRLATARQYQSMQASKATASGMAPASALQLGMSAGASKLSDPLRVGKAGLDITPRLPNDLANVTEAQRKALTANQPPLDVSPVQARAIAMDEGVGALGNPRSFSPGTLNPGPKFDPVGNGAAFADLNALKQGAPAPVPLPRDARPAAAVSAATETKTASVAPKMVKLDSGKMAKVGDTAVISGNVWTVQDNGDGTGKLIKAAPSILKEMNANTVAGGVVREKVGEAITAGKDAAVAASKPVIDTVAKTTGDLIGQAGGFLGGLFGGATLGKPDTGAGIKLSVPITTAKPASVVPVSPPAGGGATLSAPGAGLSAAQRNAMSSLAGTGMANVMAPMPATMSPGVRTAALPATNPIVVSRPKASTPAASPAVGTPKLYQAGGYVYVANPSGSGYTKVGKVASYSGGSSSSGSSGSTIRSSTSSLRPGDRTYNADTNEWVVR